MRRTLLITLEYPPMVGGVANYYHQLVQQLPAGKVAVLDNSKNALVRRTSRWLPRWLVGIRATWHELQRTRSTQLLVGQVLPLGTVAWLIRLFRQTPYFVMTHGMDVTLPFGPAGNRRKRWLVRQILKRAKAVTTVSEYTAGGLRRIGVPSDRIAMIRPCPHVDGTQQAPTVASLEQFRQRHDLGDRRVILSVGRLVRRKGHDQLLRAAADLVNDFPELLLVIIGSGPEQENVKQIIQDLGLEDHVRLAGEVSDAELPFWYALAEIFAMPNRELANHDVEGFGIVFLEANSFGKPVIGGRSGGVPDAILHEQTGLLVDGNEVAAIRQALSRLLADPAFARRLGEAGRRRVQTEFRWEEQAQRLSQLLES
jgi:phosphatidylinositol alpha-1,6-mannosyltransferase